MQKYFYIHGYVRTIHFNRRDERELTGYARTPRNAANAVMRYSTSHTRAQDTVRVAPSLDRRAAPHTALQTHRAIELCCAGEPGLLGDRPTSDWNAGWGVCCVEPIGGPLGGSIARC